MKKAVSKLQSSRTYIVFEKISENKEESLSVDVKKELSAGNIDTTQELIADLNELNPKIQKYNHLARFIFTDTSDSEIEFLSIQMNNIPIISGPNSH